MQRKMKTRTNQPVFLDNGGKVDDSKLGGTKLYKHHITEMVEGDDATDLIVITPVATSYGLDETTLKSIFDDAVSVRGSLYDWSNEEIVVYVAYDGFAPNKCLAFVGSNTFDLIDLTLPRQLTDTVTEL